MNQETMACQACNHQRLPGEFGPLNECTKCGAPLGNRKQATPKSDEVDFEKLAVIRQRTKYLNNHPNNENVPSVSLHTVANQRIALVGSIALITGVFAPLLHVPITGPITMFAKSEIDAAAILLAACLAIFFTAKRTYKFHFYAGLLIMADIIFSMIHTIIKVREAKANVSTILAGNPFKEITESAIGNVSLQWGWAVLIIGAALLIAADIYREKDD